MIDNDRPEVTIIIATYARPDALVCAVRSIQLQTFTRWRALVIGDCCDVATSDAMQTFRADPRIAYVNLPWRCGGQALPNSAGVAVADTEYVAFLNHDDVWMPEHLALALDRLRAAAGDFFLGRAAIATTLRSAEAREPVFTMVSPVDRTLREAFWRHNMYVEPASAWVVHRQFADRVGPWRPMTELFRSSLVDWALRAWRAGARVVQDERVTCLKIETHWGSDRERKYESPAEGQSWCVDAIAQGAAEAIASRLVGRRGSPGMDWPQVFCAAVPAEDERATALAEHLLTPDMADLFYRSGLDAFDWLCAEVGRVRGGHARHMLHRRTGEDVVPTPPLDDIAGYVRGALRSRTEWSVT